jgi:acid stress-induced BolA-like protein IbaG/YrbA
MNTGARPSASRWPIAQQRIVRECMNSLLSDGALLSGACRYMEMRDAGAQNTGAVFGTGVHDAFASVAHNPMCARNDSRLTRQRPATDVTAGAVLHAASVQTVAPQAWTR